MTKPAEHQYQEDLHEDLARSVLYLLNEHHAMSEVMLEMQWGFLLGCSEKELKAYERELKRHQGSSIYPDGYMDEDAYEPD